MENKKVDLKIEELEERIAPGITVILGDPAVGAPAAANAGPSAFHGAPVGPPAGLHGPVVAITTS